ncbi:hypothetical protein [Hymenobacter sp. YC55]|uniref:hypothetical protein n=1 Tax=Hymenobacter sp. YC55 TaxID=3034019 RepID=UPI0023F6E25F|nr:hypothetical protein [Hymenobacter sp. YC55]MDF7811570.1 hypothetical protein [Hymenobacter sp. YC55]
MKSAARHIPSSAARHSKPGLARAAVSQHTLQAAQQADARVSPNFWGCDYLLHPVPVQHVAPPHLLASEPAH